MLNRPMVDLVVQPITKAVEKQLFSDASAHPDLGFGAILGKRWVKNTWDPGFMRQHDPSIEYLELFAVCTRILTWQQELTNIHLLVHCDNQAVVSMINGLTSKCRNCMKLLRILVLDGLIYNRKLTAIYVTSKNNFLSDSLSRNQMDRFR